MGRGHHHYGDSSDEYDTSDDDGDIYQDAISPFLVVGGGGGGGGGGYAAVPQQRPLVPTTPQIVAPLSGGPPAGKPPSTGPPAGKPPAGKPPAGKPPAGKPPAPAVTGKPPAPAVTGKTPAPAVTGKPPAAVNTSPGLPTIPERGTNWNYSIKDGRLTLNNQPITMNGINWYGFENREMVCQMLWDFDMETFFKVLASDKCKVNAIRIPVSAEFMQYFQNPNVKVGSKGKAAMAVDGDLTAGDSDINGQTPAVALDKFLRLCYKYNMLVMIDLHTFLCIDWRINRFNDHPSNKHWELVVPDNRKDEKITKDNVDMYIYRDILGKTADYPLATVAKLWADFAEWLLPYPHVFGADIKNEPCEQSLQGKKTDWAGWVNAVEVCGEAILARNPHLFIVVEGTDENLANTDPAPCWGASLSGLNTKPIDPKKIPANKIIYSPHQYGAGVVGRDSTSKQWEPNWGFLKSRTPKECVNMGEWSASLKTATFDEEFNMRLARYMAENEMDSFFFATNNTSKDTLGLFGKADGGGTPQLYVAENEFVAKKPAGMTEPIPDPFVLKLMKTAVPNPTTIKPFPKA